MIHIKAIMIGTVSLAAMAGAAVLLATYPAVGFLSLAGILIYCFGRMILSVLPTSRT